MAKPDEVLINVDDGGVPYKDDTQDTQVMALYKLLKDLMINLSKLDWENTRQIMQNKLEK